MRRSDKKRKLKGLPPNSPKKPEAQEPEAQEPVVNPDLKVVGTVSITVYDNMDVDVTGFPSDHGVAMMIMCNAMMKVSSWFYKNKKPKQLIQVAKPTLSLADIEKLSREAKNN